MTDFLNLARLARRLGVTQQWLREQADAGHLPCIKAGNRYLFDPEAVDAVLKEQAKQLHRERRQHA